jgi:large subunit ribosomal protein L25
METVQLEAHSRDSKNSAKNLRKVSQIPAVFYGKGEKAMSLQMDYQVFRKVFIKAGTNRVIDLHIDGKKKTQVLVHQVQYYPITGAITHVDFLHVNLNEEVTTHVPVVTTGVAPAAKDLGGILTIVKHELTVRCLPLEIPQNISVDVSTLVQFSNAIHVSDVVVPKGVKLMDHAEDVVVTVSPPRKEEEVVVAPATGIEGTAAELAAKEDAVKAAEVAGAEGAPKKEEKKKE